MVWLLVLALIFALLVAVFALQNAAVIVVHLFAWQVEVSLVLVVLASATVGAVSVGLAAMVQRVRVGIRLRQLEARLRELEQARQAGPAKGTVPEVRASAPPDPPAPQTAQESSPAGGERP
ncbi:lipopolysaccharide assembly protein LapA domain-containing protein [Limnochorda pilosa]|uniref:Lipopolysaccharide assembly protein A domain-containing protein n=1 Tax=Limnochorda pilosa TaxID=1555112 RepID=A0A0K2SMW9_LIMPI|nr:LapA family protein [Limnochorda pilosa]BAS28465.1 hypothetical protein LIP_2635 [Limnochorda pilosa]